MLNAREANVLDLFSARGTYQIPAYQREYSWSEAKAEALVNDLMSWAFEDCRPANLRRNKGELPPYFLGTVLLVEDDDDACWVVDGHQRLVTLTMLFAVLRDLETAKDRKAGVHELLRRRKRTLVRQVSGWRLLALDRDREAFTRLVQTDGATKRIPHDFADHDLPEAQKRLLANTLRIRALLKNETARRRRLFLERVLTGAYVARLVVNDEDAAFSMFEVINQRGQPLASKDVIKSRLLAGLERGSEAEAEAGRIWSAMEADFPVIRRDDRGPIDLCERFLDTVVRAHETERRGRAGSSLVLRFDTLAGRIGAATMVDSVLPTLAEAYAAFAPQPARRETGDEAVDRACEYLSWWEDEEWAPVGVRILADYPDREQRLALLQRLERFAAVMGLASERKDRRLRDYARILSVIGDFDALMDPRGPLSPRGDLVRAARERICDPLPGEKAVRRAVLARVNAALDPGRTPPIPSRAGTIEHILPRTVARNGEAAADFPEWTRPQAKAAMETLGNLALIDFDANARADRRPYREKLSVYFPHDRPSPYALLEDLRLHGVDAWTPQAWRARQDRLTTLLIDAWALHDEPGWEGRRGAGGVAEAEVEALIDDGYGED